MVQKMAITSIIPNFYGLTNHKVLATELVGKLSNKQNFKI